MAILVLWEMVAFTMELPRGTALVEAYCSCDMFALCSRNIPCDPIRYENGSEGHRRRCHERNERRAVY